MVDLLVEDHPMGYPRFAAFIGSHPSFHVFRRFSTLRARLLLYKQDQLCVLEKNLADIDAAETKPLFLRNMRRDCNETRKRLFGELDIALKQYGRISAATFASRIFLIPLSIKE